MVSNVWGDFFDFCVNTWFRVGRHANFTVSSLASPAAITHKELSEDGDHMRLTGARTTHLWIEIGSVEHRSDAILAC